MSKKLWSGSVRVLCLAVVVVLGLGSVSVRPAVAQTGYVVEDLGVLAGDTSSVAWAINANGDVVGWSMGQAGTRLPVHERRRHGRAAQPAKPAPAGSILGRPELRLRDCSRWPERKGCGQICLAQVEESPGSCLVRTMLEGWYADKSCAYCARAFGPIHWQDHNPGLRSPEGKLREWSEVPPETLPEVLLTHKPICWNCMIAEGFRQRLPELVVDRPPRPHDGAVTPPAHAVDQRPRA